MKTHVEDEFCVFNDVYGYPLPRAVLIEKGVYFSVQDNSGRTFKITETLDIEFVRESAPHEEPSFDYYKVTDPNQPEWAEGQIVPVCGADVSDWEEGLENV